MASAGDNTSCAGCGNCGDGGLKACTSCRLVKYCDRDCQRRHWPTHKSDCKRAVEQFQEELFSESSRNEDCPVCFLPLPLSQDFLGGPRSQYQACCGKILCVGCMFAINGIDNLLHCPFCRAICKVSGAESLERLDKRMKLNDAEAFYEKGLMYFSETFSHVPNNKNTGVKCWRRGAELGSTAAHYDLGRAYFVGYDGLEKDAKKAKYHWEKAAVGSGPNCTPARYMLGYIEESDGNPHLAVKHFLIAAREGYDLSMDAIKNSFLRYHSPFITKELYGQTLRAWKEAKDEMKSDQRDVADRAVAARGAQFL